jgi:acylphosphatase
MPDPADLPDLPDLPGLAELGDLGDLPDLEDLEDLEDLGGLPGEPEVPGGVAAGTGDDPARLTAWVRGRVQGVGFRWWVRSRALELGLRGWAENLTDGRVKVVAEGPQSACTELLQRLSGPDTPGHVQHVTHRWDVAVGGLLGFSER